MPVLIGSNFVRDNNTYINTFKRYIECIIENYNVFKFKKYYDLVSVDEKVWSYNYLKNYSNEVSNLFEDKVARMMLVAKILAMLSLWSGYISEGGKSPPPIDNPPSFLLEELDKKREKEPFSSSSVKIKASVVIPTRLDFNFNYMKRFIKNLLLPLTRAKFVNRIYIVGNFSDKIDSIEYFKKTSLIRLIYLDKKEDKPSTARNIGIKEAILDRTNTILLLDDDVILNDYNVIDRLLYYAYKMKSVVSPLIVSWTNTFYDLFHDYDGTLNGVYYKSKTRLLYATSCCMAVPRSIFDDGVFFDEDFNIAAGEDIDFSLRVWSKGYEILPADSLSLFHDYGYMMSQKPLFIFISRYYRYGRGNYILLNKHKYYYNLLVQSLHRSTYKIFKKYKIYKISIDRNFFKLIDCLGDIS